MKDRIEINGVWYIREDKAISDNIPQDIIDNIDSEFWQYKGAFYEDELMCIDTMISEDNNIISAKYINKTVQPWETEELDNENWFVGILENNPESIDGFNESFKTQEERFVFKAYLLKLRSLGYI